MKKSNLFFCSHAQQYTRLFVRNSTIAFRSDGILLLLQHWYNMVYFVDVIVIVSYLFIYLLCIIIKIFFFASRFVRAFYSVQWKEHMAIGAGNSRGEQIICTPSVLCISISYALPQSILPDCFSSSIYLFDDSGKTAKYLHIFFVIRKVPAVVCMYRYFSQLMICDVFYKKFFFLPNALIRQRILDKDKILRKKRVERRAEKSKKCCGRIQLGGGISKSACIVPLPKIL